MSTSAHKYKEVEKSLLKYKLRTFRGTFGRCAPRNCREGSMGQWRSFHEANCIRGSAVNSLMSKIKFCPRSRSAYANAGGCPLRSAQWCAVFSRVRTFCVGSASRIPGQERRGPSVKVPVWRWGRSQGPSLRGPAYGHVAECWLEPPVLAAEGRSCGGCEEGQKQGSLWPRAVTRWGLAEPSCPGYRGPLAYRGRGEAKNHFAEDRHALGGCSCRGLWEKSPRTVRKGPCVVRGRKPRAESWRARAHLRACGGVLVGGSYPGRRGPCGRRWGRA